MKRQFPGIAEAVGEAHAALPAGAYLVRVEQAQYRRPAQKPFYALRFSIVEPKPFAGQPILSRLSCTQKAIWKLGWFLRDFLYDPELLSQDEIDEQALRGLVDVITISHTVVNGLVLVNLDGFAPASQWEGLSTGFAVSSLTGAGISDNERASG